MVSGSRISKQGSSSDSFLASLLSSHLKVLVISALDQRQTLCVGQGWALPQHCVREKDTRGRQGAFWNRLDLCAPSSEQLSLLCAPALLLRQLIDIHPLASPLMSSLRGEVFLSSQMLALGLCR